MGFGKKHETNVEQKPKRDGDGFRQSTAKDLKDIERAARNREALRKAEKAQPVSKTKLRLEKNLPLKKIDIDGVRDKLAEIIKLRKRAFVPTKQRDARWAPRKPM